MRASPSNDEDGLIILLILGVFCIIVGVVIWFCVARFARWLPATARVIYKDIRFEGGGRTARFVPLIEYRYSVNSIIYKNTRFSMVNWSTGTKLSAQRKFKGIEVGSEITIHYNPDNPSDSIIFMPNYKISACLLMLGFAMVLPPIFHIFFIYFEAPILASHNPSLLSVE